MAVGIIQNVIIGPGAARNFNEQIWKVMAEPVKDIGFIRFFRLFQSVNSIGVKKAYEGTLAIFCPRGGIGRRARFRF
jgi:hypothetical protein